MSDLMTGFVILACISIVIIYFIINIYNRLQRLHNLIPEARSNINVLVSKREDLISQLLRTVKAYGIHEKQIFSNVSSDFGSNKANDNNLIARLASLRMQFPELRADHIYEELMGQLSSVESDLQNRRERLNSTIRAYNTYLLQFPNNYIASRFKFQPDEFISESENIGTSNQSKMLAENCHS